MIGAIVAISANGVIGKDGDLPWHYSEDLKRFKQLTLDSTIIMGRNTWDSLPRKPLPKRRNIVITRRGVEGVENYSSIEEALEKRGFTGVDNRWCTNLHTGVAYDRYTGHNLCARYRRR